MEEGIRFVELLTPVEVDLFGQATALQLTRPAAEPDHAPEKLVLPARTILVAARTQPNTLLGREDPRTSSSTGGISVQSTKTATR